MLNLIPSRSSILANMLSQVHARRGRRLVVAARAPLAPFIVGAPRSGTTLLRMMLDSHPALAIPPETGFIPRALAGLFGNDEHQRLAFVNTISHFPPDASGWQDFGIETLDLMRDLQNITPFHVDEALRCFYRMYAARFNKPRWGDKTPSYGRHMRAIERVLPEACFIHMIRDGRDVALSLRNLWFSPGNDMTTLARHWRRGICTTRRQSMHCRRYLELRYESLVTDPETTLREVSDFIEIDYDASMLSYHTRARTRLMQHQTRKGSSGDVIATQDQRLAMQHLTMSPPDTSRIARWRTEMSAAELAEYESVAGGLLVALDYPRE
jgi:hypothetical protein